MAINRVLWGVRMAGLCYVGNCQAKGILAIVLYPGHNNPGNLQIVRCQDWIECSLPQLEFGRMDLAQSRISARESFALRGKIVLSGR